MCDWARYQPDWVRYHYLFGSDIIEIGSDVKLIGSNIVIGSGMIEELPKEGLGTSHFLHHTEKRIVKESICTEHTECNIKIIPIF